ncbi:cupin domain-containing protein [Microtetraspora niveoalba]|uniref:cupin domain-containing protein n=1 Tax=Microtetraspora niveoalba TaxID=46175 RepID=UPI000A6CF651|nr:cupin domain-containing protein [Microtetraspora niveoalba]
MTTLATAEAVTTVTTVARAQIRPITSVVVDGRVHRLGQQRDFRRHPALSAFLPEAGRPSFAWVRLRDGEELAVHTHPTSSMILVCRGSVRLLGDNERALAEGDVVCVPPGCRHGFRTEPGQEFHGLSVQFDGAGLYEDELAPRVSFGAAAAVEAATESRGGQESLAGLEALNGALAERHTGNALFGLLRSGRLREAPRTRARFVAALYVWSRHFQRMLLARQAVCADPVLREEYEEHLRDEYGHDRLLRDRYAVTEEVDDPVLEAACTWFVAQMYGLDEAQKIVLVHMVVETSGHLFGAAAADGFGRDASGEDFFTLHATADDEHREIGRHRLATLPPSEFPRLAAICRRAWDQMDLVHERIAAWAVEGR